MSPLSFIVYINDIFGHLGIDILGYADDLVIFDTGHNLNHVLANVQNALDTLVEGLNDIGLQLSPSKTKVMFFRLRNRMRVPSLIFFILLYIGFIRSRIQQIHKNHRGPDDINT